MNNNADRMCKILLLYIILKLNYSIVLVPISIGNALIFFLNQEYPLNKSLFSANNNLPRTVTITDFNKQCQLDPLKLCAHAIVH